ncbi:PREDICTED: succinate dehydrogenase cytochrome b560 subunit, mitochondrial-like [Papilio xuthus]|uniref:Succinate dehydrogenase C n=1 Tax=Papilio xuthus TaxID=66420 RepID=I4DLC8_PAPXU|nr:succinate dehydrogenase cytochrome b560 subunit, mitochondrial-like [Papilio xuthus]KPI94089.1 Succinate dehydrogenase cytochrome b560 subunit, mitochondrial [Papilio xuthus]BAM18718.1 succinate dehydrogenase C [Papilio xuthus]
MAFYGCARLSARPVLASLGRLPLALNSAHYAQAAALPKVNFKKYEAPKPEHYDDKNARLKRPLSPHLTIYAPQLTSILSITHRTAGIILSGYASVLGIGALVLPHDVSHYIMMIEGLNLSPATIFLAKFLIAAPFGYHFANGLRHLYWDTAKGLTIKEVYSTGYAMLATATAITLFLAAL